MNKDLEALINEAMDAMETVREKLSEIQQRTGDLIDKYASKFVAANEALLDILSDIESLDQ